MFPPELKVVGSKSPREVSVGGSRDPTQVLRSTLPELNSVFALYRQIYNSNALSSGTLVGRLESMLSAYLSVKECIAVRNSTTARMLVMKALDLKGEVIVPSFGSFGISDAVIWGGRVPVFADCLPDTWNLDPADVARRITPRTAAIFATHVLGTPCDIESFTKIAHWTGVNLIFDSSEAFGGTYRGESIGGFGDAEIFSLSPLRLLVAHEGGLITTNDHVLAKRLRSLRDHGDAGSMDPETLDLNVRMSEFNSAMALSALALVEGKLKRRREIVARYTLLLSGVPTLRCQAVDTEVSSASCQFGILLAPAVAPDRASEILTRLGEHGVALTRLHHPPMHLREDFRRFQRDVDLPLPTAEAIAGRVINLPVYESLDDDAVERIAGELLDCLAGSSA